MVLKPDLETWLLERSRKCGIDPVDYGLPVDPGRLHSIIHVEKDSEVRKMIDR